MTASERMDICRQCDWFRKSVQQCRKCHCFMPAKTMIKSSKCPLRKW